MDRETILLYESIDRYFRTSGSDKQLKYERYLCLIASPCYFRPNRDAFDRRNMPITLVMGAARGADEFQIGDGTETPSIGGPSFSLIPRY